jgi:hypothetical protein
MEKNLSQKRVDGVVQGVGSEFKPQYCKKKKITVQGPGSGQDCISNKLPSDVDTASPSTTLISNSKG